jgi:hypothetical protein
MGQTGFSWLRIGSGNEPFGSIKGREFLQLVIISFSRRALFME